MAKPFTPFEKHFILKYWNEMDTWLLAYKLNRKARSVKLMYNKLLKENFKTQK